jgi:hypothetical protein
MTLMFNYSKKEVEGLEQMEQMRNSFTSEYKDKKIQLANQKEKLYTTLDLGKWGLDQNNLQYSKTELANNKELAIKVMLPVVSKGVTSGNSEFGANETNNVSQQQLHVQGDSVLAEDKGTPHGQPHSAVCPELLEVHELQSDDLRRPPN